MSKMQISIHAPVKGATRIESLEKQLADISIHAPVKGATNMLSLIDNYDDNFNPRSRKGSDRLKNLT